jgi:hypothetical protein
MPLLLLLLPPPLLPPLLPPPPAAVIITICSDCAIVAVDAHYLDDPVSKSSPCGAVFIASCHVKHFGSGEDSAAVPCQQGIDCEANKAAAKPHLTAYLSFLPTFFI